MKSILLQKKKTSKEDFPFFDEFSLSVTCIYPSSRSYGSLFIGDINSSKNMEFIKQNNIRSVFSLITETKFEYQNFKLDHHIYNVLDSENTNLFILFEEIN